MRKVAVIACGWVLGLGGCAATHTEPGEIGPMPPGWTCSGDPEAWKTQDGELFIAKPGTGGWLRTRAMYRDVEVELEFKVPPGGNSGVALRASAVGDPAFSGLEVQILDDAAHEGLKPDQYCGSVYNAIPREDRAVRPAGEWNTLRIVLVGPRLNVWLNGRQIHSGARLDGRGYMHDPSRPCPLDTRLPVGYVALQDHGDAVRFRNISVRELSKEQDPGGWIDLFNGRDLTGFTKRGGGTWSVEEGVLVGRDGPGHLFTDLLFTDFEFRAMVKVNERGNSGMYFRVRPKASDPETWPDGYEAQVDHQDPKNFTGCIYDRAWPGKGSGVRGAVSRDGAWFDYRVRAVGDRVQTWVNGVAMVDTSLRDFRDGHIAFQTHHTGNEIMYKDIQWRALSGVGTPRLP